MLGLLVGGNAASVLWVTAGNEGDGSWFLCCRDCHGLEELPPWEMLTMGVVSVGERKLDKLKFMLLSFYHDFFFSLFILSIGYSCYCYHVGENEWLTKAAGVGLQWWVRQLLMALLTVTDRRQ